VTSAKARHLERRALRPGIEYEFDTLVMPREFSRSLVTRLRVERGESGGWELGRGRIGPDGVRRVVLRRRIIRQRMFLVPA